MQSCHETARVEHPTLGAGVVERIDHRSARCIGGASTVEAWVRFDLTGEVLPVCIDDLRDENDDDGR